MVASRARTSRAATIRPYTWPPIATPRMRIAATNANRSLPPRVIKASYSRGLIQTSTGRSDTGLSLTLRFLANFLVWHRRSRRARISMIAHLQTGRQFEKSSESCRSRSTAFCLLQGTFRPGASSESDQLVEQGHNRGCVGPPSDYCLGCSPVPEAGADPVGRKTPEIWERIDSISNRPRALRELGGLSGIVAAPADKSAVAA